MKLLNNPYTKVNMFHNYESPSSMLVSSSQNVLQLQQLE